MKICTMDTHKTCISEKCKRRSLLCDCCLRELLIRKPSRTHRQALPAAVILPAKFTRLQNRIKWQSERYAIVSSALALTSDPTKVQLVQVNQPPQGAPAVRPARAGLSYRNPLKDTKLTKSSKRDQKVGGCAKMRGSARTTVRTRKSLLRAAYSSPTSPLPQ